MKPILIILTLLSSFGIQSLYATNNSDVWIVTADMENLGKLQFYMLSDQKSGQVLKSLPDRDQTILGKTKATLFRWMQKRKNKDSMAVIELKNNGRIDFLAMQMTIQDIDFQENDTIFGNIFDRNSKNKIGQLLAVKTSLNSNILSPLTNYTQIVDTVVSITENKIYNPALVQTKKWLSFVRQLQSKSKLIYDDLEFLLLFYAHVNQTGFSHYALLKTKPDLEQSINEPQIECEVLQDSIIYMKFKSLAGQTEEIDSVFQQYGSYPIVVIDLRNTPGGKFDTTYRLAAYLANKKCDAGIFVGRKYYENTIFRNNRDNFEILQERDYDDFTAILELKQAVKISFEPQNPLHSKIYILTNQNTASACEALVQGLKGLNNVCIVGERTAGAMLSPTVYEAGNHFYILVPTADYLTSEGKSIEGIGVQPDIKTKSGSALKTVLHSLK